MKVLLKKVCVGAIVAIGLALDCVAMTLSGTVSVNENSDTAANAKINALNSARRQILTIVLSQYSNKESLVELIEKTSSDDLMNLIVSTSVSNEQMSTTDYSAKITMNLDNEAVKKWLNENAVENWVPLTESDEKFTLVIVLPNGIQDWSELKRIVREANFELETQSMKGNQVIAKLPLSYRTKFTAAVRSAGWKYADNDGVLQIWK